MIFFLTTSEKLEIDPNSSINLHLIIPKLKNLRYYVCISGVTSPYLLLGKKWPESSECQLPNEHSSGAQKIPKFTRIMHIRQLHQRRSVVDTPLHPSRSPDESAT